MTALLELNSIIKVRLRRQATHNGNEIIQGRWYTTFIMCEDVLCQRGPEVIKLCFVLFDLVSQVESRIVEQTGISVTVSRRIDTIAVTLICVVRVCVVT